MQTNTGIVSYFEIEILSYFLPHSLAHSADDVKFLPANIVKFLPRREVVFVLVLSLALVGVTYQSDTNRPAKTVIGLDSAASDSALSMKYKVAVVGGGPSGACAAEIFAQEKGIQTVMFERKMDNAKPCGGAIPLCMVGEFNMPETVVDRKVRRYIFCWV